MRQTFDSVRVELVHDRRLDIGEITNPQDVGEGEVNALPTLHRSIARSRMVTTAVPGIGFMARPTDLSDIADRAFYLAGGYKYAMAGEGCCFLHCPPDYGPRARSAAVRCSRNGPSPDVFT